MNGDDTASFIYYGLFAIAIGSYVLHSYRDRLSQGLQHAAVWVLIFLGVVVAYGFKDVLKDQFFPRQGSAVAENILTLPRARDGHFYADIQVNNVWVEFVVDTGATEIVLSKTDADRVGIDISGLRFTGRAFTANGEVRTARTLLAEMQLGEFTDTNVRATVNDGDMVGSLLGMTYLRRFSRFEIVGDDLLLYR